MAGKKKGGKDGKKKKKGADEIDTTTEQIIRIYK